MSEIPAECPACGTQTKGRAQCPGCRRVFGDDNYCPHCNATSGVRQAGGGRYLCAACNGERDRLPKTIIVGKAGGFTPRAAAGRGHQAKASGARAVGALATGAGVVGGSALAIGGLAFLGLSTGGFGLVALGAVMAVSGLGFGMLSFRAAKSSDEAASNAKLEVVEEDLARLAKERGGVLTAKFASERLGIGEQEADNALTELARKMRVDIEVGSEGNIEYIFQDIARGPKVRVESMEEELAEAEEALEAAEAALRNER